MSSSFQIDFSTLEKEKIELFRPFSNEEKRIEWLNSKFNKDDDLDFILDKLSISLKEELYITSYNTFWLIRTLIENKRIIDIGDLTKINDEMGKILSQNKYNHSKRIDSLEIIYATWLKDIKFFEDLYKEIKLNNEDRTWWYVFIRIFWDSKDYVSLLDAFRFTYETTIYPYSLHKNFTEYFSAIPESLLLQLLKEVNWEIIKNSNWIVHRTWIESVLSISWENAQLFLDRIRNSQDYLDVCFDIINSIFLKLQYPWRSYDGFNILLKEGTLFDAIITNLQASKLNYFTKLLDIIVASPLDEDGDNRFQVMLTYDKDLQLILAKLITPEEISSFYERERIKTHWRVDFALYEYIKNNHKKHFPLKEEVLFQFELVLVQDIKEVNKTRKKYQDKEKRKTRKRELEIIKEIEKGFTYFSGYNNLYFLVDKFSDNEALFTLEQIKLLVSKIEEFLWDPNLDPKNAKLIFESREVGWSSRYNTEWYVYHYFEKVLIIWKSLGIDLFNYKDRIFYYLPFSYQDGLSIIDELIEKDRKFSDKIIQYYLWVYDWTREDGLRYHMVSNFIHLLEKFSKFFLKKRFKTKLGEVVISLILDEEISIYDRENLLKFIYLRPISKFGTIILIKKDIENIYKTYLSKWENEGFSEKSNTGGRITDLCNQILIKHYEDTEAIKWRITKLSELNWLQMNFEHQELVIYSPTKLENEITSERYFIHPFSYIKDRQYTDTFLSILSVSFDQRNSHYYDYLQDTCTRYFIWINDKTIYQKISDILQSKRSVSTENFESKYLPKIRKKYGIKIQEEFASEMLQWKERYFELMDEYNSLNTRFEANKNFISQNSLDIVLFVEGKTDLQIIRSAKKVLEYQWKVNEFSMRITPCWWVTRILNEMHSDLQPWADRYVRIWLFDFDRDWYLWLEKPWQDKSGLKNSDWWDFNKKYEEILLLKKHIDYNFFLLSLPFKNLDPDIKNQIILNKEINEDIKHLWENSHLVIEHLFFGKIIWNQKLWLDSKVENANFFRRTFLWNGWSKIEVNWSKNHFALLIEEETTRILQTWDKWDSLFDNFIPLFKVIEEICSVSRLEKNIQTS